MACHAQQAEPVGVAVLSPSQASFERLNDMRAARPASYEDKVMDPARLPVQAGADPDAPVDTRGFRAWVVESRMDTTHSDSGLALRSSREFNPDPCPGIRPRE